ncbi:transketolase family protein [Candidatus Beckwithbacteria bacterium]|nr:transketolase family protein [Candidatus Beckwithbacteria bacterium]
MKFKKKYSLRDGFGQGLLELGGKERDVFVITADLKESTRCYWFFDKFSNRAVQCGVAEQNMMGIAAGIAMTGKTVFVSSFACFSPARNWDQLRISVCLQNLDVKIAGHHTGFSNFADGGSHQALEDLAITQVLPNLTVLTPADYNQAKQAVFESFKQKGPVYIRLSKYELPNFTSDFKIGQVEVLRPGSDLTVITAGPMAYFALQAANNLVGKLDVELINLNSLKPLAEDLVLQSAQKTKKVLTIEDHQIIGGLGSRIAQFLAEKFPVPVFCHGVKGEFGQSSRSLDELLHYYQLDQKGIEEKILQITS